MMAAARADNGENGQATALNEALPDPRQFIQINERKPGGEVAGPCPRCGGEDRFYIRPDDSFGCRQCGFKGGGRIDFFMAHHDTDFSGLAKQYLGDNDSQKPKRQSARAIPANLAATYSYVDEQGNELYQVRRFEEPDREKTFRQGTETPYGSFEFGVKGIRRVLYRLPEVIEATTVFLPEGEKDADRLGKEGLTATTSPMGASNWRTEYAQFFKGKDVIILPDNDQPGRQYAAKVAADLDGVAKSVKIVNLPGLPLHGDVSDWLDAGGTQEQLLKLVADASLYRKPTGAAPDAKAETKSADGGWPEPINIFDEFSIGDPVWQPDYCPSVISEFAFDEAERMGVRPEQVAGPAIISAAGVIDDRIQLQPKRFDPTWKESARLWGTTEGYSGAKKSPSKDRADGAIKEIEKALYREYQDRYALYEAELKEFEARNRLERDTLDPPPEPVRRRVICNDTTVEALRDILSDGGGATKITCLWDELSGMLATFDAYRQSKSVSRDRSLYLELFNGGSKPIDRAGKVNIFVPNWSACISGTITPEVMSAFFGKLNADGLLQRFLLYRAERLGRGVDRSPNQVAEQRFKSTIKRLFDHNVNGDITVRLSDEAQAVRESFETLVDLAYHLPGNTPAFNAHLNKYPGLFCRLCLTYHMLVCFGTESPEMSLTVSGSVAEMAAKALVEYHLPVAREFYKRLGFASQDQEAARDLCGYILSKGVNEIAARVISRSVWSFRNDTTVLYASTSLLVAYGWLCPTKFTSGSPTRWAVNPAVHRLFADQAEKEKQRRAKVRAKINEAVATFGNQGV